MIRTEVRNAPKISITNFVNIKYLYFVVVVVVVVVIVVAVAVVVVVVIVVAVVVAVVVVVIVVEVPKKQTFLKQRFLNSIKCLCTVNSSARRYFRKQTLMLPSVRFS